MEALIKIEMEAKDPTRIIAPIDYNTDLPKPSLIFQKHHKAMLFDAPHLAEVFPSPPMTASRQPDNLRKLLCKSKLYPQNRAIKMKGVHIRKPLAGRNAGNPAKSAPLQWKRHQQ